MNVNALKSFKWLKLWTKLPQLFVAKYLAFDVSQFTCNFFINFLFIRMKTTCKHRSGEASLFTKF